jgi:transposase
MRIKFPDDIRIYIACGKTDMRKSIDGLSAIVTQNFKLDPFDNVVFLFCGGKRDRMKAILWEGDGFILLYKRLEGGTFKWPKTTEDVREITSQQYRWLIEGLAIDQKNVIQKLDNKMII